MLEFYNDSMDQKTQQNEPTLQADLVLRVHYLCNSYKYE